MASLSIVVVAHTSRRRHADSLADQIHADHINLDDGTFGCDDNHKAALAWHARRRSEWAVTIEDDADPVDNFTNQLESALAVAPTPIVSLYCGRARPPQHQHRIELAVKEADANDACWITDRKLLHAVAYAIRSDLLPSLLDHTTALPIDQHISDWMRTAGHTVSYSWPSLCNHRDMPTVIKDHHDHSFRPEGRHAWTVGTRTKWDSNSVHMPK